MNVISIKDYAKKNNVTYEAVRQQVNRYADELGGHIIRDGRQQFLDEEAVAFLDGKRQKNPVVVIQQDKDETIEQLRQEKEQLLMKIASQADKISKLSEWKSDNAVAIAEADQRQRLLEAGEKKIKELEAQNADLSADKDNLVSDIKKEKETAQKLSDELKDAKKQLQAEKHRRLTIKERLLGRKIEE